MSEITVIHPSAVMSVIERAATDPNVDIEKMERLLAMHERLVAVDSNKAYSVAMASAQSKMRPISANAENKVTHSKYASYSKLDSALRPIYSDAGFALSFNTDDSGSPDVLRVTCRVSHTAGHSEQFRIDMPADGKGAKGADVMTKTHATGAAATYGMRYLLKMIFNVAVGEDYNDGNGVSSFPRLTTEQADEIKGLLEYTRMDVRRFLSIHGDAPSVDAMHAVSYNSARHMLNGRKAKMDAAK